jgi:TonB family protein
VTTLWRSAIGGGAVAAVLIVTVPLVAQSPAITSDYDQPPQVLKLTKPTYPAGPFSRKVQGTVEIEIVIDEKGRVTNPVVIRSVEGLDQAALDCVKQWKFKPAQKGGRPVKSIARAPVTFRITDDKKYSSSSFRMARLKC